jgi:hypothetical protein
MVLHHTSAGHTLRIDCSLGVVARIRGVRVAVLSIAFASCSVLGCIFLLLWNFILLERAVVFCKGIGRKTRSFDGGYLFSDFFLVEVRLDTV